VSDRRAERNENDSGKPTVRGIGPASEKQIMKNEVPVQPVEMNGRRIYICGNEAKSGSKEQERQSDQQQTELGRSDITKMQL
jgi:hypothetical protein